MNIPAYGVILDYGETNVLNSILQCLTGISKMVELFLFNNEYLKGDKNIMSVIKTLSEKQVKNKCIIQPKSLYGFLNLPKSDDLLTVYRYWIEDIISQQFQFQSSVKVRFSSNVANYFSILSELRNAIENDLPKANIEYLNNKYLSLRNNNINDILYTSAECIWRKELDHRSSQISDIFYSQLLVTTRCESCTHNKYDFETVTAIELDQYEGNTIEDLLTQFMKENQVDSKCVVCDAEECYQQKLIIRAPQCLVLSVKQEITLNESIMVKTFTDVINKASNPATYELMAFNHNSGSLGYDSFVKRYDVWNKYTTHDGNIIKISSIQTLNGMKPMLMFYVIN